MLMDNNSYPGREYLSRLIGLNIDVAIFGKYPEKDSQEDERCGNLWIPITENKLEKHFNFFRFSSLKSHNFLAFLKKSKYELGIQGGTGIINKDVIDSFNIGIVNFHPETFLFTEAVVLQSGNYSKKMKLFVQPILLMRELILEK